MTGNITVQAVKLDIPLRRSDLHADLLDKEIRAAGVDKLDGVTVRKGQWALVHVLTTISPELETQIKDTLKGFEVRLGGIYSRQADLDYLRGKYSGVIVDAVADGTIGSFIDQLVASLVGPRLESDTTEQFYGRVYKARNDPMVVNARNAQSEFTARQTPFDIRLLILKELQVKFGEKIKDLAIINGDATVSVVGDYDAKHIEAVHATVDKHDKSIAPSPEKSNEEIQLEVIATLHKAVDALNKRVTELEGKKVK